MVNLKKGLVYKSSSMLFCFSKTLEANKEENTIANTTRNSHFLVKGGEDSDCVSISIKEVLELWSFCLEGEEFISLWTSYFICGSIDWLNDFACVIYIIVGNCIDLCCYWVEVMLLCYFKNCK